MNLVEYIYVTSRPYRSLLREINISGKLFTSKQLAFNMQMQTQLPALNFEALWINYEGEPGDKPGDTLVPLHTLGHLEQYKAVPFQDVLGALRKAARPLANMDDMMGA